MLEESRGTGLRAFPRLYEAMQWNAIPFPSPHRLSRNLDRIGGGSGSGGINAKQDPGHLLHLVRCAYIGASFR
jgi:hypothetical protein